MYETRRGGMGQISNEDLKTIAMMERAGVLQEVDGHRLPTRNGVILVFCGDGDQSLDLLPENINKIFVEGDRVRPHLLARNGGGLLLPPESPLYQAKPTAAEDLLDEIVETYDLKDINTVALYVHAPCGKAGQFGLAFEEIIRLLKRAKIRVLERIPDVTVACFIHIDRNGAGKATRFLEGERWREWQALSLEVREARYGIPASTTVEVEAF